MVRELLFLYFIQLASYSAIAAKSDKKLDDTMSLEWEIDEDLQEISITIIVNPT